MSPLVVHVDKEHIESFVSFLAGKQYRKSDSLGLTPDGHNVWVILPASPFDRSEIQKQAGVSIAPHPFGPGVIGSVHAFHYRHLGAHPDMTPYELRKLKFEHPNHPHALLDPEFG